MALGFGAVRDALAALDIAAAEPTAVLNTAAKSFLNAVGASSGPLYATALHARRRGGQGQGELDDADVVAMFQAMAKGIQDRGKAERGEKTMIDAWVPAADAAGERGSAARASPTAWRRPRPRHGGRGSDQGHVADQGPLVASRRAVAAATSTRAPPRP